MTNAYIYPFSSRGSGPGNPYLGGFIKSLARKVNFVNIKKPSATGIIDVFRYVGKIDLIFLNWVEDLPEKRGGLLQVILFYILLIIFKIKGIKIFYTLHNRESHYSGRKKLKKLIRKTVIKNADYLLCHASEGMEILKSYEADRKSMMIHHPFITEDVSFEKKENKYDILMWGAIKPYKAIDKFLGYLEQLGKLGNYRMLVIGKIIPDAYEKKFEPYRKHNINIVNEYADDQRLNDLISKSSIVVFTYNEKSVLSSGALVYSLTRGAFVIGPDTGSFRDLYNEGIIDVYGDFEELVKKIDICLSTKPDNREKLNKYIENNTWEEFGEKISEWINI